MATNNQTSRPGHAGLTAVPTQDPDSDGEMQVAGATDKRVHSTSAWSDTDVPIMPPSQKSKVNMLGVALTHFTRRLIFPFFLIAGVGSAALTAIGFFNIIDRFICLLIMVGITWMTSCIAMLGVWKWGAAEEYIEFAKVQNSQYQKNNEQLKHTRLDMQKVVRELQDHAGGLEKEAMDLERCMESFEELQEALGEITEADEEVMEVVDGLNEQYNRMKMLTIEQDKAQLLLTYYKVQFSGRDDRFSRHDYERFVGRLNASTRKLFDENGGFGALDLNDDGHVDPDEFIRMTESVLGNNDELIRRLTTRIGKE